ncbi:MAG: diguanylate cyclase [Gammaproteobacteria bacterium]|nr:diguanylate cyclase [Gammaproteobacteria bacterium]
MPTDSGSNLAISTSIGLAVYPEHGSDPGALLRTGDEAMYKVKATGRTGVAVAGVG